MLMFMPLLALLGTLTAHAQSADLALEVAAASELRCAAGAPCGSVVLLTGGDLDFPSWCTGTLVAPDLILTAAHCIPNQIRSSGSSCAGWLAVTWPSLHRAAPTACAEIVNVTQPEAQTVVRDVALIRIAGQAPRGILPVGLSAAGMPDDLQITIPAVHGAAMHSGGILATVRAHHCHMATHTMTLPSYDHPFSPETLGVGCDSMVNGTSGSAVMDLQGRIRGVFHASHDFRHIGPEDEWPRSLEAVLEAPTHPASVTWITNLACEERILRTLGLTNFVHDEHCDVDLAQVRRDMSHLREALGQRIIEQWRNTVPHDGHCPQITVGNDRAPRVSLTPCHE